MNIVTPQFWEKCETLLKNQGGQEILKEHKEYQRINSRLLAFLK